MEGVFTATIVLFHQDITELRMCENCVFFLPVNILTGVTRRLLGPHDTLPCVLIPRVQVLCLIYTHVPEGRRPEGKCIYTDKAQVPVL